MLLFKMNLYLDFGLNIICIEFYFPGIDPGIYSQELMENCRKIVSECNSVPHPEEVISESALEAESPGSSTILVAYFDGQVFVDSFCWVVTLLRKCNYQNKFSVSMLF